MEGLSRRKMDQTLRPHSPLRVLMNLTSTTLGIRCWECSATHMMASSWKHYWMRWIWEESRSAVISLWVCCVTKRRFIVLKEISLGTVALGESLVGSSGHTSLLRRRSRSERGSAANPSSTSGGHVHALPLDLSNTTRVAPLPSKWPYRLEPLPQSHLRYHRLFVGHPSRLVDFSLLVVPEPSRTFNVDCTPPSFLQLPFYLFHPVAFHRVSWRLSVPSSTRVPGLAPGVVVLHARSCAPRRTRCLANGFLVATASFTWVPLLVASGPSPMPPFKNWLLFQLD